MREGRDWWHTSAGASMLRDRKAVFAETRCPSFSRLGRATDYKQRRRDKSVNAQPPRVAQITPKPIAWASSPTTATQRANRLATSSVSAWEGAARQPRWDTRRWSELAQAVSQSLVTMASMPRVATVRAALAVRALLALRRGLAFRSSPREGSASPGRTARTSISRAGIPPAGIRMVWRDNLCVVRSINLVFTDETELVPPIPRFAIGQWTSSAYKPIPIRHGISRPFISQSERTRNGACW